MTVYLGDCLQILDDIPKESVDLIYLDPPFFTQKVHKLKTRDNKKEYAFNDTWDSLDEYLDFMQQCLWKCKDVMKNTGSIFLHCDNSASHHLRIQLDKVFGIEHFQNEIIWSYRRWSHSKKGLLQCHQNIYFYSKTDNFKFNRIMTDYSPTSNIDQILQERERNEHGKSIYKRDDQGNIIIGKEKVGVPLSDVWNIPYLNPKARERVGYPTQKPFLLLEQILKIASNPQDVVLDPFCGSGTTLVTAKLMDRSYIGIDVSPEAVRLTNERLANPVVTRSPYLEKGDDAYLNKSEFELAVLKEIGATPVQRNTGIDGFLKRQFEGSPIAVRIQKENEPLAEAKKKLLQAGRKKGCKLMLLFKTSLCETAPIFDSNQYEDLLVIDCYGMRIDSWIERHKEEYYSSNLVEE